RRQRLLVGGAGILAELSLAAWATLAWGLLPDGVARSMAFTLAATTWISSLAINLSPFMRFDGYFLAMDALDMPNLHPRSFAMARWHLREVLFRLDEPVPEHHPAPIRFALIAFAWGVWIYRLTLFLGIAVLVYHFFIKVVGLLLFGVEIGWFVIKPIATEIAAWRQRAGVIRTSRRARFTFAAGFSLIALVAIPWSGRVTAPAILKAAEHVALYAPAPAVLVSVNVVEGERVAAGQILVRLANPDTEYRLHQAERHITVLRYELSSVSFEDGFRGRSHSIAKELDAALAEQAALVGESQRMSLTAPMAGMVTDVSHLVQPGQWVNGKEALLGLRQGAVIEAYVGEDDLPRITLGTTASFIPEGAGVSQSATLIAIDRMAVRNLTEPALAVPYGGTIAARFDKQSLIPDVAVYRLRLAVADQSATVPVPLRGEIHLEGERRSMLGRAVRAALAVIIREWGT
ncbi:MAG: biotin/lipoyl-binding protein, partial [Magnetospirillum sp.]|nr:biotin/lipoyl-binding protein [Magnetospirillum sp.]